MQTNFTFESSCDFVHEKASPLFRFGIKLEEKSLKWARVETAAGTVAGRAAGATGATEAAARVEHRVRQVEATAEVRVEQMRNWPENWMTPVSD
jgi:L-asparaginase/Glu-tRNA(Gln) amidotransferase subunit D